MGEKVFVMNLGAAQNIPDLDLGHDFVLGAAAAYGIVSVLLIYVVNSISTVPVLFIGFLAYLTTLR
jgi:hypothetical protein